MLLLIVLSLVIGQTCTQDIPLQSEVFDLDDSNFDELTEVSNFGHRHTDWFVLIYERDEECMEWVSKWGDLAKTIHEQGLPVHVGQIHDTLAAHEVIKRLYVIQTPQILFLHNNRAYNTTIASTDEAMAIAKNHHLAKQYKSRRVKEAMTYTKIFVVIMDKFVLKVLRNNIYALIGLMVAVVAVCALIMSCVFKRLFKEKVD